MTLTVSDLSLILPTLNERENALLVIDTLLKKYPTIGEIIVVDDNSSDGTAEAVETQFLSQVLKGQIRVICRTENLGLTPSLSEAVTASKKQIVGWMDCDGSMPIDKVAHLLAKLSNGYDLAVASRFAPGGAQKSMHKIGKDSRFEIYLSTFLNWVLNAYLKLPITDLTSGFIVIRKNIASQIQFRGSHGEYFIFLILDAYKLRARMVEIPYICGTRQFGNSKTFGTFNSVVKNTYRYAMAFFQALLYARKLSHDPRI